MYATKTKKIASYGRRTQRFVAVSDDRPSARRVDNDTAAPGQQESIIDTYKNPFDNDDMSLLMLSLSSKKHDPRVRRVITGGKASSKGPNGGRTSTTGTPGRRPLGLFPTNVPDSPAVPPKSSLKPPTRIGKGLPSNLAMSRQFSPFVDVDIIVCDEKGKTISQERRVSRTDVQVNAVGNPKHKRKTKDKTVPSATRGRSKALLRLSESDLSDDSDDSLYILTPTTKVKEKVAIPARVGVRQARSKLASRLIVISSSSECDSEEVVVVPKPARRDKARRIITSSDSDVPNESGSKTIPSNPDDFSPLFPKDRVQSTEHSIGPIALPHTNPRATTSSVSQPQVIPKKGQFSFKVDVLVPPLRSIVDEPAHHQPQPLPEHMRLEHVVPQVAPAATIGQSMHMLNASRAYSPPRQTLTLVRPQKARKLTPIRPDNNTLFGRKQKQLPIYPSSPTESDLDLSFDLSLDLEKLTLPPDLQLHLHRQIKPVSVPYVQTKDRDETFSTPSPLTSTSQLCSSTQGSTPSYLRPLLMECAQEEPIDFEAFIETFPADPIHFFFSKTSTSPGDLHTGNHVVLNFQKIGEASYSEVFGIGDVVLKVVPLRDEDLDKSQSSKQEVVNEPFSSDAKDVLREIIVTRAMGEMCDGFIRLLRTHVVRGAYPPVLLSLWDEYNKRKGSEAVRPDVFTQSQAYAIIILPNGGPDLEAFTFSASEPKTRWRQACSVFWQITRSLARAEELVRFEHRDLHWGQILVKQTAAEPSRRKGRMVKKVTNASTISPDRTTPLRMDDPAHGVVATVIDLGLARIDRHTTDVENASTYWTPFDEMIFEGEGDYQYEIYRMMREHNGDSWEDYRPFTNVMWLHYLSKKILRGKRLRAPATNATCKNTMAERRCYECLLEVEKLLGNAMSHSISVTKAKGRRKTQAASKLRLISDFKCAMDVLKLGIERGWVG